MIDQPNLKILFHTSHNDIEGRFEFVFDPPQPPPVEIVDHILLGQKIKRKKVSTLIDPPNLKILFHKSHNDKEGRFVFVLDPPQPPPVEIVDPIILGQKMKMMNEILIDHPRSCDILIQPITVKLSRLHSDASSSFLDPPQPPLIEIEDNLGRGVSFRKNGFLKESPEGLMSLLCVHPSAETTRTKTENLKSWLSPPQPPAMELDDDFSCVNFREKQFNINKFVKSQITLTFMPPAVTTRQSATPQQQQRNGKNVDITHFFRLESPQSPPLDIQDNIQKPASKIKNIHEPECLKDLVLILQHSHCEGGESSAKNEYHGGSLLRLDPPQPPPVHLEDKIQKPVFKILRTISRICNVLQEDPSLHSPQIPTKICIDSPRDPSLFRLSPPQPPLIEIEDVVNRLVPVLKRCLDHEGLLAQEPVCVIPAQTQEPPMSVHDFQIPSTDLQRPQVDINDKVNTLLKSPCKVFEEHSNCDVTVTVPRSPLITSCRKELRRSPPTSPPTELADKPNSINFCKKNYYQEMISASVQFLQPQSHSDVLRKELEFS